MVELAVHRVEAAGGGKCPIGEDFRVTHRLRLQGCSRRDWDDYWDERHERTCMRMFEAAGPPRLLVGRGGFQSYGLTQHTLTNMEILGRFLPVRFEVQDEGEGRSRVEAFPAT